MSRAPTSFSKRINSCKENEKGEVLEECKNMLFFKESSHLQRITIARSTLVKDETFKQWFGIVSYSI